MSLICKKSTPFAENESQNSVNNLNFWQKMNPGILAKNPPPPNPKIQEFTINSDIFLETFSP